MKFTLPYRLIIVIILGPFTSGITNAQQSPAPGDSAIIEPTPIEEENEEYETYFPDTLTADYRPVNDDSVLAIDNDKGFYYKRYLDSLLRATQIRVEYARTRLRQDSLNQENKTRRAREGNGRDGSGDTFGFDSFFGFILWVAAIGLFAYLVYKLFLSNSSVFGRSRRNITDNKIQLQPVDELNEADKLLLDAIKNGDYRLAIRYLYLHTLKRLSEKKFIQVHPTKTNYEYVNEMRKHRLANDFAALTLQYEYVWYGEYPVDQNLFDRMHDGFNQFNKNLGRH